MAVLDGFINYKRAGVLLTMATVYGVEAEHTVNAQTGEVKVQLAAGDPKKLTALYRSVPFEVTRVRRGVELTKKSYDFGKSMGLGKKPTL
ncbi:hypothetical protein SEA_TOMAS_275 [Streptomyces phage Tomas]|uniref:Uncharacterized protein n=1 Tax=Streptomyces phage Tomas TaxID=2914443 RepID=A0AA49BSW2_9CAUD|nr:hypothetical protein PP453_gp019 [Streptomyces phage Tomas]YP_010651357.1 hypothetical protein PP453_gp049 [Streptomyces phage Tomas]UMO76210.1 hypothetical protein SEA_TOMAS_19 [Streptomyces phage Tomas]UMO76418.1 hypothetical protein SEA_TOMAS_275 [Streptomyces phage Tomas]